MIKKFYAIKPRSQFYKFSWFIYFEGWILTLIIYDGFNYDQQIYCLVWNV
jgi:hypothetical protein